MPGIPSAAPSRRGRGSSRARWRPLTQGEPARQRQEIPALAGHSCTGYSRPICWDAGGSTQRGREVPDRGEDQSGEKRASLGPDFRLVKHLSPSPRLGRAPAVHEDRRTPAVHKDRRTPAPQSSASPHQVQSRSGLSGPSGVPVPTGNLPGWQLTYSQDFSGTTLPPGWGAYSGEPGGSLWVPGIPPMLLSATESCI